MNSLLVSTSLEEIIKDNIMTQGPMRFGDFMELALYHPELGYYSSDQLKFGTGGDFFTSPEYSPVFGYLLGRQIKELWENIGSTRFTIVEYGAGTGSLCKSILNYFENDKGLYDLLDYCIIEKSPGLKRLQKKNLPEKVSWYDHISHTGQLTGCILSNELVDNLAVQKVTMGKELSEVYLDYNKAFFETHLPADEEVCNYFEELGVQLPPGFITEVNLNALDWLKEIAGHLESGYIVTIDYGYPSSELYSDVRKNGTLTCYHKHRVNYQPYLRIGEQDITAHVNFSALCLWGHKYGLEYCGFREQGKFLMALGFNEYLKFSSEPDPVKAIQHEKRLLTLVGDMGQKFKVLIQQKGVLKKDLKGFRSL